MHQSSGSGRTVALTLDQGALGVVLVVYGVCLLAVASLLATSPVHAGMGLSGVAVAVIYVGAAVAVVYERAIARWLMMGAAAAHVTISLVWAHELRLIAIW